jgi:hypothetical protein
MKHFHYFQIHVGFCIHGFYFSVPREQPTFSFIDHSTLYMYIGVSNIILQFHNIKKKILSPLCISTHSNSFDIS